MRNEKCMYPPPPPSCTVVRMRPFIGAGPSSCLLLGRSVTPLCGCVAGCAPGRSGKSAVLLPQAQLPDPSQPQPGGQGAQHQGEPSAATCRPATTATDEPFLPKLKVTFVYLSCLDQIDSISQFVRNIVLSG